MVNEITPKEILDAYERLFPRVRHTPILKADFFEKSFSDLYLKLELHQLTGSFKIRGVINKILSNSPKGIKKGIIAASGGNHGRAVAYAGWKFAMPTTIYLPEDTHPGKIQLIEKWGAMVKLAGVDLDEAIEIAHHRAQVEGKLFIHPYADPVVTAGQGTIAVEILQQLPDLEVLVVAIGGGGLISGIATYLKSVRPEVSIIGVEPEGCPTLYNSLSLGKVTPVTDIQTSVGTLAIRCTSEQNFQIIQQHVDEVILVSDEDMLKASRSAWREIGVAAELSGVAPLAGLLTGRIKVRPEQKICALIGGMGAEGTLSSAAKVSF